MRKAEATSPPLVADDVLALLTVRSRGSCLSASRRSIRPQPAVTSLSAAR